MKTTQELPHFRDFDLTDTGILKLVDALQPSKPSHAHSSPLIRQTDSLVIRHLLELSQPMSRERKENLNFVENEMRGNSFNLQLDAGRIYISLFE
jgi:hypothetical protein